MQLFYRILYSCGVFFASIPVFCAAPASAQAARTFVSETGSDNNNCSRAAPCRTFNVAQTLTAAGGEIRCLDIGGFGTVTITKSITIDCTGTNGSILTLNSTGVLINTPGVNVVLRGLSIFGGSTTTPGNYGVRFLQGTSLAIIDSIITNFISTSPGVGIMFTPSTSADLQVINTVLSNNRVGILVLAGPGSANVTLENVKIVNSAAEGLRVGTTSNSGAGAFVIAADSTFSNNATGVALITPPGTNYAVVKLVNSRIASNTGIGVLADGPTVRADVSGSTISNNGQGVAALNGSILLSYLNNVFDRNSNDGAFTGSVYTR